MSYLISESMLPEFDVEMTNTRKVLERVPDAGQAFRPHMKSMTLGKLAAHVSDMPLWGVMTLGHDQFDMRPNGVTVFQPFEFTSAAETLAHFDDDFRQARALLVAATDETMMRPWSLLDNGNVILSLPKVAVMRSFVMNHMIHHRAQLIVYLRLNDVPVPGLYGPSADEQ